MVEDNRDLGGVVAALGLESAVRGELVSEASLAEVFSTASVWHCAARFLRLGGPKQFRADVIAIVDETGKSLTPGYRWLLDENITEIEFLLTSPYAESFLSRMDAEKKTNAEIWRVKHQVLEFARGLMRASQQRASRNLSAIKIAFHQVDLVWNLSIAEGHCVVARAYWKSATGHDSSIAELHLHPDSPSRLAEALTLYYRSVRNDSRTDFVSSEEELDTVGAWPSLFKGNAIRYPADSSVQCVEKSNCSEFGDKAEAAWLSFPRQKTGPCHFFNPVRLDRQYWIDTPWKGQVSCIRRVDGVMASDLLRHIQGIGIEHHALIPKLEIVSGSIIRQAFLALSEFRDVGRRVRCLKKELRTYPWARQLDNALLEAGRFVIESQRELSQCRNEARKLGMALEAYATEPFRDAHLKNRIIKIDRNFLGGDGKVVQEWLEEAEPIDIFRKLQELTYDIDFETCFWRVSEWDDPMHILWTSHLGLNNAAELANKFSLLTTWWKPPSSPTDETVLWMTLLCRSLREYCRRLWYDHVMPETYQARYGFEKRDHFLDLALLAAEHIDGYTGVKVFLDRCRSSPDSIWNQARLVDFTEPVVAKYPSFLPGAAPFPGPERPHVDPVNPPVAAIRDLLQAAFDAGPLRRFCQDRAAFRSLIPEFSPKDSVAEMAEKVIGFCSQRLLWDELLAGIKEENSRQYDRFVSRLYGPTLGD